MAEAAVVQGAANATVAAMDTLQRDNLLLNASLEALHCQAAVYPPSPTVPAETSTTPPSLQRYTQDRAHDPNGSPPFPLALSSCPITASPTPSEASCGSLTSRTVLASPAEADSEAATPRALQHPVQPFTNNACTSGTSEPSSPLSPTSECGQSNASTGSESPAVVSPDQIPSCSVALAEVSAAAAAILDSMAPPPTSATSSQPSSPGSIHHLENNALFMGRADASKSAGDVIPHMPITTSVQPPAACSSTPPVVYNLDSDTPLAASAAAHTASAPPTAAGAYPDVASQANVVLEQSPSPSTLIPIPVRDSHALAVLDGAIAVAENVVPIGMTGTPVKSGDGPNCNTRSCDVEGGLIRQEILSCTPQQQDAHQTPVTGIGSDRSPVWATGSLRGDLAKAAGMAHTPIALKFDELWRAEPGEGKLPAAAAEGTATEGIIGTAIPVVVSEASMPKVRDLAKI